MGDGAKAYQKNNADKFYLTVVGIKNEVDYPGQIRLVEQMIKDHVNAIVIAPAGSKELVPVLKQAILKGILVVNIDNKLDDAVLIKENINIPFVGPSNKRGAQLVGEYLAKQLQTGDEVAIVEGLSSAINAKARTSGFKESMEASGMKVVTIQSADWEKERASALVPGILKQYPQLKGMLFGNDDMALGGIEAINAAGKTGKIKVISYDNIPAVKQFLANGALLATVDQHADTLAVFGIELALNALHNKTPQQALPAITQTPVDLVIH